MLGKRRHADPIRRYKRRSVAARSFKENDTCACGESRPEALVRGRRPPICTQCLREEQGKPIQDKHHPAGRANNPTTIEIPANDHRAELNPVQYDWPKKTRENPDGSPLLAAAACIRGFSDTDAYLIETLLLRNPEMLEKLDAFLVEKLGSKWWVGTELESFTRNLRRPNVPHQT